MSRCFSGLLMLIASLDLAHAASPTYHPITPSESDRTVVLSGHDLTVEQVIAVARFGAKAALTPEARQRSADAYGLLTGRRFRSNSVSSFYPDEVSLPQPEN